MLAKIDWNATPCEPQEFPEYSGFPFWEAFVTEPNKERRVCDFLAEKLNIHLYWPHYTMQRRLRCRAHVPFERSVLPCLLLAPIEFLNGTNRDRILNWVHLRPLRISRHLTKAEVEIIREIEGRLNIRYQADKDGVVSFNIDQRVRFRNDLYSDKLGDATVTKVAPGGRISIKIDGKLFGGKREMVVSAVELEAM